MKSRQSTDCGAIYPRLIIMKFNRLSKLIRFLQDDLDVPENSLALVLRQSELSSSTLPMLLWQYGLIDLHQLDRIFDWLETR